MKKFISAKMINLADPRIGSKIIFKTDDFFAAAHRIRGGTCSSWPLCLRSKVESLVCRRFSSD